MPRPRALIGLLVLAACFPIRDFGCDCGLNDLTPEQLAKIAADKETATKLMSAWIAAHGGTLRVHDEALDTDWISVTPGIEGFEIGSATLGDEPTLVQAKLKAQRADRPEARARPIDVDFTMMPGDHGLVVVAASLRGVWPDPNEGGPPEDRQYHACPVGSRHFQTFAAGESPCHHVPLVPLHQCGCDQPMTYSDPTECARFDRKAELKSVCRKDRGEPLPQ